MTGLSNLPLTLIFIGSVVAILGACEIGHRVGRSALARDAGHFSTLEASMLGLLALMISFTFSMSLSRYEARREGVLNEANAIGTTALRARLLPAPHNTECLKLLREYVQIRLDVTRRTPTTAALKQAIERSNAIQEALWQHARSVARVDRGIVPTGLFIQSLNDMIDNHEKRLAAALNRLPSIVLLALYAVAAIAMGFAGYATGRENKKWRTPVHVSGIVVAALILLIQDLDRPTSGFIVVSQQPMIDVAASLADMAD